MRNNTSINTNSNNNNNSRLLTSGYNINAQLSNSSSKFIPELKSPNHNVKINYNTLLNSGNSSFNEGKNFLVSEKNLNSTFFNSKNKDNNKDFIKKNKSSKIANLSLNRNVVNSTCSLISMKNAIESNNNNSNKSLIKYNPTRHCSTNMTLNNLYDNITYSISNSLLREKIFKYQVVKINSKSLFEEYIQVLKIFASKKKINLTLNISCNEEIQINKQISDVIFFNILRFIIDNTNDNNVSNLNAKLSFNYNNTTNSNNAINPNNNKYSSKSITKTSSTNVNQNLDN